MASAKQTFDQLSDAIRKKKAEGDTEVVYYVLFTPPSIFDAPDLGLGFRFIDTGSHLVTQQTDGLVYSNEDQDPIDVSLNDEGLGRFSLEFFISMKCNVAGSPTLKCGAELRVFMPNSKKDFRMLASITACSSTVCIKGSVMNDVDIPVTFA